MRGVRWALMGLLAGCSGAPSSQVLDALPEPSQWRLREGSAAILRGAAIADVRLRIDQGGFSGDSGCNSFNASYTLAQGRLTLGALISTKRGCADERGVVEQALYASLRQVSAASLQDDRLRLTLADGGYLEFQRDPDAQL